MIAIDDMATPEEWCKKLQKSGASVSARALRTLAREHGQYYSLGRAMMLTSSHIEALMRIESAASVNRTSG